MRPTKGAEIRRGAAAGGAEPAAGAGEGPDQYRVSEADRLRAFLALDSSTQIQGVALEMPPQQVQSWAGRNFQPQVAERLRLSLGQNDWRFLDALAVGTGPGLFTGLRTGLAFAQGLARSLRLPCYALCSFAALALDALQQVPEASFALVARQIQLDDQQVPVLGIWRRAQPLPHSLRQPSPWRPGLPLPRLDGTALWVAVDGSDQGAAEPTPEVAAALPGLQWAQARPCPNPALAVLQWARWRLLGGDVGTAPEQLQARYLPLGGWKTLAEQRRDAG